MEGTHPSQYPRIPRSYLFRIQANVVEAGPQTSSYGRPLWPTSVQDMYVHRQKLATGSRIYCRLYERDGHLTGRIQGKLVMSSEVEPSLLQPTGMMGWRKNPDEGALASVMPQAQPTPEDAASVPAISNRDVSPDRSHATNVPTTSSKSSRVFPLNAHSHTIATRQPRSSNATRC